MTLMHLSVLLLAVAIIFQSWRIYQLEQLVKKRRN